MTPDSPTESDVSYSVSSQIASAHRTVQCKNMIRELRRFYPCDALVQSMQLMSTANAKIAQCISTFRCYPYSVTRTKFSADLDEMSKKVHK